MTHSKPSKSNLTMASEYALIAGSGAAAVVSVVTQQVTVATLSPIAALVAVGLINRSRLDQQLQDGQTRQSAGQPLDTDAAQGASSVPPRMLASLRPDPVAPRPQMVETRIPSGAFSQPQPYIAGPLAVKRQAQADLEAHLSVKLRQIGEDLKQRRQAKGWSVDQIYLMTFIQPHVIHAIEFGNLRQLPEPFYIRAFLQKYALALGLDGGAIAQRFATL